MHKLHLKLSGKKVKTKIKATLSTVRLKCYNRSEFYFDNVGWLQTVAVHINNALTIKHKTRMVL